MKKEDGKVRNRSIMALVAAGLVVSAAVLAFSAFAADGGGAQHVRWDIISLVGGNPPGPINPGGHASATAPDGVTITLTGSGTFAAPASGGGSGAATGGGTWMTSSGGSGTYTVTGLVSWQFANLQTVPNPNIDNIDDGDRANGNAVLTIAFSDGTQGVLTVGCHGPGAPPGIIEGIATTKAYKTYYAAEDPEPGVDANRTVFHVR
jgi:hypothetical protein